MRGMYHIETTDVVHEGEEIIDEVISSLSVFFSLHLRNTYTVAGLEKAQAGQFECRRPLNLFLWFCASSESIAPRSRQSGRRMVLCMVERVFNAFFSRSFSLRLSEKSQAANDRKQLQMEVLKMLPAETAVP